MSAGSRQDTLRALAAASVTGNLGLFIGAGFSKALTNENAPSWRDLLKKVSQSLGLGDPFQDPVAIVGKSYPNIASAMVGRLTEKLRSEPRFQLTSEPELRKQASSELKMEVVRNIIKLKADPALCEKFRRLFGLLNVSWIITTNYDFLIEDCLEHAESLTQDQVFRARRPCVPVYHLHGSIYSPQSLVLLEEDYALAQNPTSYPHLRLAVALAESTTLMIGYALGDPNIQTAISYGRTINKLAATETLEASQLFFLNRSHSTAEPRFGNWSEVIIDTPEIEFFLEELEVECGVLKKEYERTRTSLEKFINSSDPARQIRDRDTRNRLIKIIQSTPAAISYGELSNFVRRAFTEIVADSAKSGGWQHYTVWLGAALDFLTRWRNMPKPLFLFFADELCNIAPRIEPNGQEELGFAFSATKLWHQRKQELGKQTSVLDSLKNYAEQKNSKALIALLSQIK